MGVMLIAVAAMGIVLAATVGNLLICQSQARTAADSSALAAASALDEGSGEPCSQAATVAQANKAAVTACSVSGQDVQVSVGVTTRVPFIPTLTQAVRAGPRACT